MNVSSMANLMTFIPVTPIRIVLMGEHRKVSISQATSSVSLAITENTVVSSESLAVEHNLRGYDATHLACALIWQETRGYRLH